MSGSNPFSAGLSAARCPVAGCTCRNIVVRFHDALGRPIAGIVLPRATAEAFFAQFGAALDGQTMPAPSDLQLRRCEGSA